MSLPEPFRGCEPGSFAEYTVTVRLKRIARQVLADNDLPPERAEMLHSLITEMPEGTLRPIQDELAPDLEDWRRALTPYAGQNWLQTPWILCEFYFFRRILEGTGYFQPGPGFSMDPYRCQKELGLREAGDTLQSLAIWLEQHSPLPSAQPGELSARLAALLRKNLWGNQADLSMWPAGSTQPTEPQSKHLSSTILVDHSDQVASILFDNAKAPQRVAFILDNTAVELVYDLALADFMIASQAAGVVDFHCKAYPTYVSDVTISDIGQTLDFLSAQPQRAIRELASRLHAYLQDDRLTLSADPFWNAPFTYLEAPARLHQVLAAPAGIAPAMVISKGDANYRRFLGDRHWPIDLPLEKALPELHSPLALVRVLKSEISAGLPADRVQQLEATDPKWMISGKYGIIQLVHNINEPDVPMAN